MATPVVPNDVRAYAPEFTSTLDARIELYIELAKLFVYEPKWGRKYKQAVCLLTAHMLTETEGGGNASGPIASESVGELSISYTNEPSDDDLQGTSYGGLYYALRKTLTITPLVV